MTVITRIAPSPTGNLHLGTVRTALYNVLFARKHNGKFLFRLEDTDRERSKEEFTQEIIDGFNWLGISWDGEMLRQSTRNSNHSDYILKLLDSGKAYKCYASPEELDLMRKQQRESKQAEGYDNRGRTDTQDQIDSYIQEGRKPVVRLNLGEDRDIVWEDMVRGTMSINTKDLGGDPVIQKANGQILYNFAVVADDHDMGMTHILRGEDHLTNTAKQIVIYEALGFNVPSFGHLPLIFTKDKQKLSKRKHGDIAGVEKYRKEGYLPEALVNYLVSTSYTSPDSSLEEVQCLEQMSSNFDYHGLSKSPAIYDIQKLNWFNREYIAKLSHSELMNHLGSYLVYDLAKFSSSDQEMLIESIRGNLNKFDEINSNISYFFEELNLDSSLEKFLIEGVEVNKKLLERINSGKMDFSNANQMKEEINLIGEEMELKAKNLFWPIRIAISYRSSGPDLGLVMYLLGKDLVVKRLEAGIAVVK
jgi:glutamyl-tRNA synthetase